MSTPTEPDECQLPSIIARRMTSRQTPAQRIHAMKAADHDAATAGPIVVMIREGYEDADLSRLVERLGERLGAEAADRRWLMELVEQLLHRVDTVVRDAERKHDRADPDEATLYEVGYAEGAADLATALNTIMTTYMEQP